MKRKDRGTSRRRSGEAPPPFSAGPSGIESVSDGSRSAPSVVTPGTRLTGAPRWLMMAIVIALPFLLLGALELALRAVGYGDDYPLFVIAPQHPEYLQPNPQMARRYFANGPFVPTPSLDFFRANRTSKTYRIVFQGESSAQGFPYGHGGMPSRMLEQRLAATFPDRDIEVVNTALTGVNSYTLRDQVDEVVAQHPDAVLIYTGHNEYYGVFGAGAARGAGLHRPLVLAYLAVGRSRIVQLLAQLIGHASAKTGASGDAPRTVMQFMAGEQQVALGSTRYVQGLEQFRANLADILSRYHSQGIPVLIGTLASNERDQPPLAGAGGADSADVYYALARRLDAANDMTHARVAYREAKERDPLRFRAPEAMNRIVREEAARHGAIVVETQRAIEDASPGGVPGHTLILEHLHPNLDGYFVIADAFYETMHAQHLIGDWTTGAPATAARHSMAVTPVDSLVAILRTDRLTSGWPFRPRGAERTPVVDTLHPRTEVEELAQSVVLGRLPWPEATERLRVRADQSGDTAVATRAALALAGELRPSPEPLLDLADMLLRRGNADDALRYARAGVARQPTPRGNALVGSLLFKRGDRAAAMPYLKQAAETAPNDRRTVARYVASGALSDLERRHATSPRDQAVLYDLALAYALTDQNDRARTILAELLRVAPDHRGGKDLLEHLPK